ncbi:hypothetical protein ACR2V8_26845 [Klebsiella pneumoniae]
MEIPTITTISTDSSMMQQRRFLRGGAVVMVTGRGSSVAGVAATFWGSGAVGSTWTSGSGGFFSPGLVVIFPMVSLLHLPLCFP